MGYDSIHVGDYGWIAGLEAQENGAAIDLSQYDQQEMIFRAPDGTISVEAAGWKTNGEDGIISFTVPSGFIDQTGVWTNHARVIRTTPPAQLTTKENCFYVSKDPSV